MLCSFAKGRDSGNMRLHQSLSSKRVKKIKLTFVAGSCPCCAAESEVMQELKEDG